MTNQLRPLSVVTFGPVVASARLPKDKVVWSKQISEESIPDCIHCARLEVDKHSTWDVLLVYWL
jgi:hypothetical protein